MYRLTARMLQRLERDLGKYHDLFSGGRCQGWEQEELIVAAIKSDTSAQHHVRWQEAGHDDRADIQVQTNGKIYPVQIKSGKLVSGFLVLSGHRLGRFDGDLDAITEYLRKNEANILSIAYKQENNDKGRQHIYQVSYVDIALLRDVSTNAWKLIGKSHQQVSSSGVQFAIRPSMSWQIWWKIPAALIEQEDPIVLA